MWTEKAGCALSDGGRETQEVEWMGEENEA